MKRLHPILRLLVWKDALAMKSAAFLARRPHRSFKRTYRRDYARSLKLPGYWAFTGQVIATLWRNKRTLGLMVLLYAAITVFIGGLINQDTYTKVNDLVKQAVGDISNGSFVTVGQAAAVFFTAMINPANLSPDQQVYMIIIGVLVWLTAVWLLREIMAGRKPKLRDGLYSAGAPIVSTSVMAVIILIQMIPIFLVILAYSALNAFTFLTEGFGAFLFWTLAGLVIVLSLYWTVSSFFAMIIVTLPGMYPMQALRASGDLVVGRRLRVLFRILWMITLIMLGWLLLVVPTILFDSWIKGVLPAIKWLPIVPAVIVFVSSLTIVWAATYIYMLYRRIVDDSAKPA